MLTRVRKPAAGERHRFPSVAVPWLHEGHHVTRRGHFPVANGGLFRPCQKPGEVVRAGQALGEIMNIHGHVVETPTAPQDLARLIKTTPLRVVGARPIDRAISSAGMLR